jgi:hypothetical protein
LVGVEDLVVGELYAFVNNAVGDGVDLPFCFDKSGGVVVFGNAWICGIGARNVAEGK